MPAVAAGIHELRNRLTSAILSVNAMVDEKLAPTRTNLREVSRTLADVQAIIAHARSGDFDHGSIRLVDLNDVARNVANGLMMLSAAGDVTLTVTPVAADRRGCSALRADPIRVYRAFDEALGIVLAGTPPGSTIEIACPSAQTATLAIRSEKKMQVDLTTQIAAHMEPHGGSAHRLGRGFSTYCLHFAGDPACECAAGPECGR